MYLTTITTSLTNVLTTIMPKVKAKGTFLAMTCSPPKNQSQTAAANNIYMLLL